MNPNGQINRVFTLEEWNMICRGILSLTSTVDYHEIPDKDVECVKFLISLCADFYNEVITKSFTGK